MSRDPAYRILILGGYGHFGARIAAGLADLAQVHIVIAGRHLAQAEATAARLRAEGAAARLDAAALDAQSDQFTSQLQSLRPDVVVHTAGPFQGRSYDVARACIAVGCHYVDLADGRDFVSGITSLDEEARRRGVLIVSGASSVPALSGAVVDRYRDSFAAIDSISVGIVPGNRAPRGLSTIASVLSYCGRPLRRWQNGRWRIVYGWQDLHSRRYRSLGRRWLATCDVPDLELFPARYGVRESVVFHAGIELSVLQLGLWMCSWLARWRLVSNWQPAAAVLKAASDWTTRFGSDEGGMHVDITGTDASSRARRVLWTLIARKGHGPQIPCIAAVVVARKLATGQLSAVGARPCLDLMTLADFDAAASQLAIEWHEDVTSSSAAPSDTRFPAP